MKCYFCTRMHPLTKINSFSFNSTIDWCELYKLFKNGCKLSFGNVWGMAPYEKVAGGNKKTDLLIYLGKPII
jgi:hypothetical protein